MFVSCDTRELFLLGLVGKIRTYYFILYCRKEKYMVHAGLLHFLDLDSSERMSTSLDDQNMQVYDKLGELCTQLEVGVTAHTTILYPRLISILSHLPKEMLVQLYHEVSAGRICPQHQRLRSVSFGR